MKSEEPGGPADAPSRVIFLQRRFAGGFGSSIDVERGDRVRGFVGPGTFSIEYVIGADHEDPGAGVVCRAGDIFDAGGIYSEGSLRNFFAAVDVGVRSGENNPVGANFINQLFNLGKITQVGFG